MLDKYIRLINEGKLVAFPTETVYGLGASAWNPSAVQKVFDQKGRPADNPLIVHVSSQQAVGDFARDIPAEAKTLMDHFWPGPLTLIFPKQSNVLDIVTGGLNTVAVRRPNHPLAEKLITQAGPLVAPSANTSGKPSPTKPEHVREDFGEDFPLIEGGETDIGLESTVLDVSQTPFTLYRPGAISAEEIESVIGVPVRRILPDQNEAKTKSPGTKYTHYAPAARVQWLNKNRSVTDKETLYLLHSQSGTISTSNVINYRGNYARMAHELYDRFRQADHDGFTTIAIEPFTDSPPHQMIPALANRIEKALSR